MALKDKADKLNYAWEQLEDAPFDSEQYQAAYEYIDEEVVLKNFDPDSWNRLVTIDSRRFQEWYAALGGAYQSDSEDNPLL